MRCTENEISYYERLSKVYPKQYRCDFCDKVETGKPFSWLTAPVSERADYDGPLRPYGWEFIYSKPCKDDSKIYSCGCHKFNK